MKFINKALMIALFLIPSFVQAQGGEFTIKGTNNTYKKVFIAYKNGKGLVVDSVELINGSFSYKAGLFTDEPVRVEIFHGDNAAKRVLTDGLVLFIGKNDHYLIAGTDPFKYSKITGGSEKTAYFTNFSKQMADATKAQRIELMGALIAKYPDADFSFQQFTYLFSFFNGLKTSSPENIASMFKLFDQFSPRIKESKAAIPYQELR